MMKKLLLLVCIIAATNHVYANFISQGKWRWHKDDGSEKTATYLGDVNATPIITSNDSVRLRTELYNPQTGILPLDNTTLAYSTTGEDGSWITISDTVTNHDFILASSPFLTNFEATTQQLPARSGYTFQSGKIIEAPGSFIDSLEPGTSTEYEWVIKPTATAKLNTTYYFETSVLGYDQPLPTLTIGAVLPVTITSFTVNGQNNKAVLKWTTTNEINSDHFEIVRSKDGLTWQTVTSVKAKGNSSTKQNSYAVVDNNPIDGGSFYRLRQYDKDGKIFASDIKPFTIQLAKAIIATVYPNPTPNTINIQLKNHNGTFKASLMNAQGVILLSQTMNANSTVTSYKLDVNKRLSAGVYFIYLTGKNLSQKIKVVVE